MPLLWKGFQLFHHPPSTPTPPEEFHGSPASVDKAGHIDYVLAIVSMPLWIPGDHSQCRAGSDSCSAARGSGTPHSHGKHYAATSRNDLSPNCTQGTDGFNRCLLGLTTVLDEKRVDCLRCD